MKVILRVSEWNGGEYDIVRYELDTEQLKGFMKNLIKYSDQASTQIVKVTFKEDN